MTKDEALKLALEFVENSEGGTADLEAHIKEALAQRTWVGLTDEDCDEVERWVEFKEEGSGRIPNLKLILYIENKLKEKNS